MQNLDQRARLEKLRHEDWADEPDPVAQTFRNLAVAMLILAGIFGVFLLVRVAVQGM